jgi:hypothetical protein
MKRTAYGIAGLTALLVVSSALARAQEPAKEKTPWIHIQVNDEGEEAEKVNINLPLSLVEVAIDVAPEDALSKAHVHLDHHGLTISDLRRLWQEFRAAGEEEFVTVEKHDERVHILRRGDHIVVEVEKSAEDKEEVHVEVPISVIDALLSGEGDRLNLKDAVAQLKDQRGEIVRVNDGKSLVRIWIDEGR